VKNTRSKISFVLKYALAFAVTLSMMAITCQKCVQWTAEKNIAYGFEQL